MASSQPACPPAQVVANAFVHQYYHILHQSPEMVFRFYQDSSVLGRPEAEGRMSSVTTMQAINEKILSLDYNDLKAEIKTVDAQKSLNEGVLVLVTGYLTGKDNVRRNFTQTFFLAPQDKGYFVLNDVFRYTEDAIPHEDVNQGEANDTNPTLSPEQAPENQIIEPTNSWETEEVAHEEVYNPSDNEEGSVVEEETPVPEVVDEAPDDSQQVPNTNTNVVQEEAPKKSYASIVKVMTAPMSTPTHAPQRSGPPYAERLPAQSLAVAVPAEMATSNSNVSESGGIEGEGADGYSIYIKSLPLNATPAQLEEEFKRFGPIRKDGVQVRSNKQQGFCYGFVEFEAAIAVQSAIEASPITIGGRQAHVEEKRPSGSRVSSRARYPSGGRGGGYRNDSGGRGGGGGRGNYWNSRGYGGRGEYGGSGGGGGGGSGRGEFNNNRGGGVGRGVTPGRGEGGYKAKPASTPRVSASA